MSRMPQGQGPYSHPHQQQMYYPPPPQQQQHMGYPPPPGHGQQGDMYGAPPPHPHQHTYPRQPPPPPMMSNGGPGPGWSDNYGPPPPGSAGSGGSSSRMANLPPPTGPSDPFYPPGSSSGPPPGSGWSSVPPGGPSSRRPGTRGGNQQQQQQQQPDPTVKLEDLISNDGGRKGRAGAGGMTSAPLDGNRPLTSTGPPGPKAAGGPGASAAAGAAGGDDSGAPAGPSEFIKKLYKMLEEESAMYGRGIPPGQPRPEGSKRGSVGWGRGGQTFVVWDMNDFTTKILPQTFRHSNFSSFVRQLNKYGFSKIKHTDENTGQIKENVWEFQHPNFQAGGKADLDSIKRKAVVPKKGEDGDGSTGGKGMSQEDAARLSEMEGRVSGLEDQLALALEEIRQARVRESGLHSLAREMIMHMTQLEKGTVNSPMTDPAPSPQISRLHHLLDTVAGPSYVVPPPLYAHNPLSASGSSASNTMPRGPMMAGTNYISPESSGASPAEGSKSSRQPRTSGGAAGADQLGQQQDDVIELPNHQQTLYNGDPVTMTPVFADAPSWLTENTTTTMPMYHRKSSDGATLRLMLDTLAAQGSAGGATFTMSSMNVNGNGDSQDPLDTSPRPTTSEPANANGPSPFGSLSLPPHAEQQQEGTAKKNGKISKAAVQRPVNRRSTTITTSWTHAPRILVVEDDVVYRQLSSKFLEKFGCVIETVEDAQQAIEKMNHTKYDLVLMDIFFGPSMDGRKATSLIRQFDMYTPIISMTSNAQPQDVDSYLQSGMNDVLAKPFTKHGLFGILDKHLIHLKAIQMSAEIPRSLGLPPLSDQGIMDAVMSGNLWNSDTSNPLSSMGWSDETYQLIFQACYPPLWLSPWQQFLQTGSMPEMGGQMAISNGAIGTNVIFGDNRKRAIELIEDDWTSPVTETGGPTPQQQQQATPQQRDTKRMKGGGISAK